MKKLRLSGIFLLVGLFLLVTVTGNVESARLSEYTDTGQLILDQMGIIDSGDFSPRERISEERFAEYLARAVDDFTAEGVNDEPLTAGRAAEMVVKAVDQKEFALTYPGELATEEKYWQAAREIGLFQDIPYRLYQGDRLLQKEALVLLIETLQHRGQYQKSLGDIEAPDLFGRAVKQRQSIDAAQVKSRAEKLFELGNKGLTGIEGGIFTGYVVKSYRETPLFAADKTIRYNHSSTPHLRQMLSLLRREGFDTRVKVVPRISSYVHLIDEWGPPAEEAVTSRINEDRAIVHEDGYDLVVGFEYLEDLNNFNKMVDNFARRREEDTSGLIADPWYAPVYVSQKQRDGYRRVGEIRVDDGEYYLYSFVLEEHAEAVAEQLAEMAPEGLEVELDYVYVNPAFIGYLEDNLE